MHTMSLQDAELSVLSVFFRAAYGGLADLVGGSNTLATTDPITGLPISANDLTNRAQRVGGEALAFECVYSSRTIARSQIHRNAVNSDKTTPLSMIAEPNWTESERQAVKHQERLIGAVFARFKQDGLVQDAPIGMDGENLDPHTPDAQPSFVVRLTRKGLDTAKKRVRGTKWERGPTNTWDVLPAELRAQSKAQWARGEAGS